MDFPSATYPLGGVEWTRLLVDIPGFIQVTPIARGDHEPPLHFIGFNL